MRRRSVLRPSGRPAVAVCNALLGCLAWPGVTMNIKRARSRAVRREEEGLSKRSRKGVVIYIMGPGLLFPSYWLSG